MKTFIMLDLPESTKDYLQAMQVCFDFDDVSRCKLHLTLKFVGDTSAKVDQSIRDGIQAITLPRLKLFVNRVGVFYNQVNVVWAGLAGDVDELAAFAETFNGVCGFRSALFNPHITLGRTSRHVAGFPVADVSPVFSPTALVYVESVKVNGETVYRTLERIEAAP
jgi:2'-5' RNA ligase